MVISNRFWVRKSTRVTKYIGSSFKILFECLLFLFLFLILLVFLLLLLWINLSSWICLRFFIMRRCNLYTISWCLSFSCQLSLFSFKIILRLDLISLSLSWNWLCFLIAIYTQQTLHKFIDLIFMRVLRLLFISFLLFMTLWFNLLFIFFSCLYIILICLHSFFRATVYCLLRISFLNWCFLFYYLLFSFILFLERSRI